LLKLVFPLGSRASETGSELSQSQSVSSLDHEEDERLRQVGCAEFKELNGP